MKKLILRASQSYLGLLEKTFSFSLGSSSRNIFASRVT